MLALDSFSSHRECCSQTPEEAIEILTKNQANKEERIREMEANGYPAYTTSAGWLGYSDEKIKQVRACALYVLRTV